MSGEWDDGDGGALGAALRAFHARERAAVARLAAAVEARGVAGFAGCDEPEAGAMAAAWVASAGAWARGEGAGGAVGEAVVGGSGGAAGDAVVGVGAAVVGVGAVVERGARVGARRGAGRRWRWLAGAAVAAAAVLAGIGWLWLRGGAAEEGLAVKGPPAARLVVVASRGEGEAFAVEADARLMAGDRLGFFVAADAPGAVAVWWVDGAGATRLAPTGGRGGAFGAGALVALPEGARLTAGAGCEWVVAAFGAGPLPLGRLDGALRAPGGDGCGAPGVDAVAGVRWQLLRVRR